jgi:hypothetical protein
LDGNAQIKASAECRDVINAEILVFPKYQDINLEVKFTLYYDYSKETVTDTIIRRVTKQVA